MVRKFLTLCRFRWAYCQLEELKRGTFLREKDLWNAIHDMPASLDETYERMLLNIEPRCRTPARTALTWLAFWGSSMDLDALVEALITDPENAPYVDEASRELMVGIV